ncbi:ChbG/HpnK family deacetylase [Pseudomonas sp. P97.38]|uniref:ChbG/HpnK family deacetylase n=1 Tax=Pseudomonas sp. P97.38 TaxID=255451 RepID=UPI00069F0EC4|nr:ChbG/HpnK family deacetylase [Pseudomonas sp. P97.38]
MPHQVIVNADDFGLCSRENRIIVGAFEAGLISSATIMANMPGFEEACVMSRQPRLKGRIGLHFNLSHGQPLSQAIKSRRAFCDAHGQFNFNLSRYCLRLGSKDLAAIEQELKAQWQRCLDHGLHPSHLDSHQHVHNIWPIGELVARFATQQGVSIRLARNIGTNLNVAKRIFKTLFNRRLRRLCAATADYVCTPADLQHAAAPDYGVLEVIAHPTQLDGDFGDIYLPADHSLTEVLHQRLAGVPRVGYGKNERPFELVQLKDTL